MPKNTDTENNRLDRAGVAPDIYPALATPDELNARGLGWTAQGRLRKRIKEGKETSVEKTLRDRKAVKRAWATVLSWDPDLKRGRNPKPLDPNPLALIKK